MSYLPGDEPGPAGASVEPLGEGLISVFPDGFSPLFCPAAALPALLVMPAPAVPPVAFPVVVPPAGDPVVVLPVAAPPVAALPPAEPPVDCASAQVPVNASAVASPNVASFMIAPFSWCITSKRGLLALRSRLPITVRCCSQRFSPATIWKSQRHTGRLFCGSYVSPADISHPGATEDCPIELAALSRPLRTVRLCFAWNAPCPSLSSSCCSISR